MMRHLLKKTLLTVVAFTLVIAMGSCAPMNGPQKEASSKASNLTVKGAKYVGSKACEDCHDEVVSDFSQTTHGRIESFETTPMGIDKGCESCHGPASKHIEDEDPSEILSFKGRELTPQEKSAACLKCHRSGDVMDWKGSRHDMSNVACTDCHTVHKKNGRYSLKTQEPQLCYSCHQKQRGQAYMPSHHPIKEGKMVCSDCHNPHTSSNRWMLRTEERINDLCFKCHADKEGPFVFEHAPVVENCAICHEPHGTVANNLLKQNEPFICLQCHHLHFHSGLSAHKSYGIGKVNSIQQVMTTKCTECHTQIHGSNLPSNTRQGMGRKLTR